MSNSKTRSGMSEYERGQKRKFDEFAEQQALKDTEEKGKTTDTSLPSKREQLNHAETAFFEQLKSRFSHSRPFVMDQIETKDERVMLSSLREKKYVRGCDTSEWIEMPDGTKKPTFRVVP